MNRTILLSVLLAACSKPDPGAGTLAENVSASFESCNEAEIRYLADKHSMNTAFRPCASNDFSAFQWSPDGRLLYFQLVMTSYVMNADASDKATMTIPVPSPTGSATWMTNRRLLIPTGAGPEGEEGPHIIQYDIPETDADGTVTPGQIHAFPVTDLQGVSELQRGGSTTDLYFTAAAERKKGQKGQKSQKGQKADATRHVYHMDLSDGAIKKVSEDWPIAVSTMTYHPGADSFFASDGKVVLQINATTGEQVASWPNAKRGSMSPEGTWLALEFDAPETSIFYQSSWDEQNEMDAASPEKRKRVQRKIEALEGTVDETYETRLSPPTISYVHVPTGRRWAITEAQGNGFQWYPATKGFGSFFLWGIEGKQFRRNVMLADLRYRLDAMVTDTDMLGVVDFDALMASGQAAPASLPDAAPSEDDAKAPSEDDAAASEGEQAPDNAPQD